MTAESKRWSTRVVVMIALISILVGTAIPGLFRSNTQGSVVASQEQAVEAIPSQTTGTIIRAEVTQPVVFVPEVPQTHAYTVVYGDTLTRLARNFCSTVSEIASENHISDPNRIYEGQTITLKKVDPCSPESVKSKTSPENVLQVNRGASQEKSFSPPSADVASPLAHDAAPTLAIATVVNATNCASLGRRLKDQMEKLRLRAKCIEEHYGDFIREGIAKVDGRVSLHEVIAMILVESSGNPSAVNPNTDCHGLMQLQTPTAEQYGVANIYDPRENILGGIKVLVVYTYEYYGGSRAHGMAAYNMGPGTLNKVLAKWKHYDPVTRNGYFREVERIRTILEETPLAVEAGTPAPTPPS